MKVWLLIEESKFLERTMHAVEVESMTFTRRIFDPDMISLTGIVVGSAPWPDPVPDVELKEIES